MRNDLIFNYPRFKNVMSCLIQKMLKNKFHGKFCCNSVVKYF